MKNRIFDICDQLTAQGVKPTLIRVRSALGGGSFSTINPLLQQWKEEHKKTGECETLALRNEIASIHLKSCAQVWETLSEHYMNFKKEQEDELLALREKVAKADAVINSLQRELEAIQQEKTKLEKRLFTNAKR